MSAPGAGQLNRQITLETLTVGKDSAGGMTRTWTPFATVWARVRNLSGNERSATGYGGQVAEARTEFTIRHLAGVTASMRVTYDGRHYDITHVNDYEEAHRFLILTCAVGVSDG